MKDATPQVYAGIIDEIGRRQYSGNVTWLREYIQIIDKNPGQLLLR